MDFWSIVSKFLVPCCYVPCDFLIKTMFGSSLPLVVCRRAHVLFTLFVFVCIQWCHIVLYFSSSMLPVSLDCSFFIASSVFSNVCLFLFAYCHIIVVSAWNFILDSLQSNKKYKKVFRNFLTIVVFIALKLASIGTVLY